MKTETPNFDWYYDNMLLDIQYSNYTFVIETLRLFYPRVDSYPHWHNSFELQIITDGEVEYQINEQSAVTLHDYQMLLIPPMVVHSEKVKANSVGIILGFSFHAKTVKAHNPINQEMQFIIDFFSKQSIPLLLSKNEHIITLFENIYQEIKSTKTGYLIYIQNLLINVLLELYRQGVKSNHSSITPPEKNIDDNISAIISNYFNLYSDNMYAIDPTERTDPSLKELSEIICMSESQTARYLKKYYGKTFIQLLNESKINLAKFLLVNTNISISSIANKCKWSEKYMFLRFREDLHISPLQYRKQHSLNNKKYP